MTMPALIQKHERQVRVTSLAKIQSVLSQLFVKLSDENGGTLAGLCEEDTDHNCFAEKMLTHLKYTKYCPGDNEDEFCKSIYDSHRPHIILEDGIMLQVYMSSSSCASLGESVNTDYLPDIKMCASFKADINGIKKPNHGSKDIFGFTVLSNGQLLPWGSPKLMQESKQLNSESCYKSDVGSYTGSYCSHCYLYGDCRK